MSNVWNAAKPSCLASPPLMETIMSLLSLLLQLCFFLLSHPQSKNLCFHAASCCSHLVFEWVGVWGWHLEDSLYQLPPSPWVEKGSKSLASPNQDQATFKSDMNASGLFPHAFIKHVNSFPHWPGCYTETHYLRKIAFLFPWELQILLKDLLFCFNSTF